jgi:hypothetical protein
LPRLTSKITSIAKEMANNYSAFFFNGQALLKLKVHVSAGVLKDKRSVLTEELI